MLAEDYDVDVVVVGTREPGLVERVMRHSVSQEVARRVHRDLFIVHPEH
jgi:nucleotide-binding universal stress UspA family protein